MAKVLLIVGCARRITDALRSAVFPRTVMAITAGSCHLVIFYKLPAAKGSPLRILQEVPMQAVQEITQSISLIQEKPVLLSYDSGSECSLDHYLEVRRIVELEEIAFTITGEDGQLSGWK